MGERPCNAVSAEGMLTGCCRDRVVERRSTNSRELQGPREVPESPRRSIPANTAKEVVVRDVDVVVEQHDP